MDDIAQAARDESGYDQFRSRVRMWAHRYDEMRNRALLFAGGNTLLTWEYGATEEHCTDCKEYEGTTRAAVEWQKIFNETGHRPQARKLSCNGYNCDCRYEKVGKPDTAAKFNPHHEPAGSPIGGQFAEHTGPEHGAGGGDEKQNFDAAFAKRAGIDVPDGADANIYIRAAIQGNQSGGRIFGEDEKEYLIEMRLQEQYETMGDYYKDVTNKAAKQLTIDTMNKPFITKGDKVLMGELFDNDKVVAPIEFEFVKSGTVGDVPWENQEWGLQEHGIRPADLRVGGTRTYVDNELFGSVAHITIGEEDRLVVWHEVGHTVYTNYVEEIAGEQGTFLLEGDMYDRFAERMVEKADKLKTKGAR